MLNMVFSKKSGSRSNHIHDQSSITGLLGRHDGNFMCQHGASLFGQMLA